MISAREPSHARDRTLEALRSLVWERRRESAEGGRCAFPSASPKRDLAVLIERIECSQRAQPVVPPFTRLSRPVRFVVRRLARVLLRSVRFATKEQRETDIAITEVLRHLGAALEGHGAQLRRLEALANEMMERASRCQRDAPRLLDVSRFDQMVRGNDEELRDRLRFYTSLFEGCRAVLDVGCGRGAFLDLLREKGIGARGVDQDEEMVQSCRARNLDVECAEALEFLRGTPDGSFDGIFCCELVEHLGSAALVELIELFAQKLRPAGIVVIETLQPECLQVLYRWFWMDLTHQRLVHPVTLQFLLESCGFRDIETQDLRPVPERELLPPLSTASLSGELAASIQAFNRGTAELNRLLLTSPEYYVRAIR